MFRKAENASPSNLGLSLFHTGEGMEWEKIYKLSFYFLLDLDERILKQQQEEEERKRQRRERKKEKKVSFSEKAYYTCGR